MKMWSAAPSEAPWVTVYSVSANTRHRYCRLGKLWPLIPKFLNMYAITMLLVAVSPGMMLITSCLRARIQLSIGAELRTLVHFSSAKIAKSCCVPARTVEKHVQ